MSPWPQPATTRPWRASSRCCKRTSSTTTAGQPVNSYTSRSPPGPNTLPPPSPTDHPQPLDPDRIQGHHKHPNPTSRAATTCHLPLHQSRTRSSLRIYDHKQHAQHHHETRWDKALARHHPSKPLSPTNQTRHHLPAQQTQHTNTAI